MAARRLQPYRQGRLDGLCGVYALINALRLLCPRLDEDACEAGFLRPDPSPSPADRLAVGGHFRRAFSAGTAPADRPVAAVRRARVRDNPDRQSAEGVGTDPARHLAGLLSGARWQEERRHHWLGWH